MDEIKLKAGDVFCSAFPSARLGGLIKFIEQVKAHDFSADFSHCGIIFDAKGTTWEALWTIKHQDLFEDYKGCKILIARYKGLTGQKRNKAFWDLAKHDGQWYPVHRLLLHLIGLARFIHWDRLVCSEFTAKYLYYIGARHKHYWGCNPDTIADELKNWKIYDIIFDGVLS